MTHILKNCPFCGGKATSHQNIKSDSKWNSVFSVSGLGSLGYTSVSSKYVYYVSCNKCKGNVGPYSSQKTAETAWNRRPEV